MAVTFHSSSGLFIDLYKSGGKIAPYTQMLDWSARQMLEKTTIFNTLARAKALHQIFHSMPFSNNPSEEELDRNHEILRLLHECLSPLVDDLLLISAFEINAKTELLRKRYVVHEVLSPKNFADHQRKHPIHVRTVQASQKTSTPITFKNTTIGLCTLLKNNYKKYYPMSPQTIEGLKEVQERRNLVHFHIGYGWTITENLFAFVEYLNRAIPPEKRRRKS